MINTMQTRITASSIFLVFQIGIQQVELYNLSCPLQGNWKLRAEIYCNSTLKYFCLFNNAEGEYIEGCDGPDWDRKGSKREFSLSFTRGNCSQNDYQPIIFRTNERMSDCVFAKSVCSEEGQTVYQSDSSKKDRTCRCDYAKSYAFIKIPRNYCYCIPTEEDCSCYIRSCPVNYTLSTDYECIQSGYMENSKCKDNNQQNKKIDEKPPVENEKTTRLKLEQRQKTAIYVLCNIGLLFVIVGGKFLICFHRRKTDVLRRNEIQFLRIIYLLYRVACPVVRMKFNNEIKPYQLGKTLDENKLNMKEQYRDKETIINDHQWDLLYNHDKGIAVKSEYFDLRLMMCLLRSIVNIKICDVYPELGDESVSAMLSRIKYIRNKVARTFGADLPEDVLNQHWDDMRQALLILVRKLDIQNEQEDTGIVDNLKLKIKQIPLSRHLDHVYNTFTDLTAEEHNFLLVFYVIAKIVYPVIKDEFEKKCTETHNSSTRTESRNLLKTMISELKEKAVEEGNKDYCIQLDVINDIQRQIVQSSSGTLTKIEMQDFLEKTEKAVLHFGGTWNEEKISHLQKMENILNQ